MLPCAGRGSRRRFPAPRARRTRVWWHGRASADPCRSNDMSARLLRFSLHPSGAVLMKSADKKRLVCTRSDEASERPRATERRNQSRRAPALDVRGVCPRCMVHGPPSRPGRQKGAEVCSMHAAWNNGALLAAQRGPEAGRRKEASAAGVARGGERCGEKRQCRPSAAHEGAPQGLCADKLLDHSAGGRSATSPGR